MDMHDIELTPHIQIHFKELGNRMHVLAHVQGAHGCAQFTGSIDLDRLEQMARALLERQAKTNGNMSTAGLWGSIKKAAKSVARKVAKTKLVKQVVKQVSKVRKSPILKAALTATAVVMPAVGVPALAAVTSANALLDQAEAGSKVARASIKRLKSAAARGAPKARRALRMLQIANRQRKTTAHTINRNETAKRFRLRARRTLQRGRGRAAFRRLSPAQKMAILRGRMARLQQRRAA